MDDTVRYSVETQDRVLLVTLSGELEFYDVGDLHEAILATAAALVSCECFHPQAPPA